MPGANALELSASVRRTMEELKKNFPDGVDYSVVYDPTIFVRHSIEAVVHTLFEALLLVVLVVILFLQTWRPPRSYRWPPSRFARRHLRGDAGPGFQH